MPIIDPDQGVPTPAGTDLADNPAAFTNFYTPVLSRLNLRYTNEANRTALHPANVDGEESYLTASNRKEVNNGALWLSGYVPNMFAYVRKAATQTVNNSTALVNDTELFVALPTTGVFGFSATLFYSSSTTADFKIAFTNPAGSTARWGAVGLATAAVATTGDGQFAGIFAASGTPVAYGGAGVGTSLTLLVEGDITMGGTAGNLQLQWAQNTLDPTNTDVMSRSRLEVWRSA